MIRLMLINTQEWIRLKFFQIVIFLSLLFVGFSQLLGSLSFTEQQRLVVDFGLAGIELALLFMACFFSTHALAKEIERKTILVILARPIPRWKVLMGYFGSLAILNLMTCLALGITLFLFISSAASISFVNYLIALVFIYLKSLVIGAFGLMISVAARPMFAFVLSIVYWLISYSVVELSFFIKKLELDGENIFIAALNFLFPQFYKYNWKSYGFLKAGTSFHDISWATLHSIGWIAIFLYISALLFRRKEIV